MNIPKIVSAGIGSVLASVYATKQLSSSFSSDICYNETDSYNPYRQMEPKYIDKFFKEPDCIITEKYNK